jgi:hypothetical protein
MVALKKAGKIHLMLTRHYSLGAAMKVFNNWEWAIASRQLVKGNSVVVIDLETNKIVKESKVAKTPIWERK